MNGDLGLYRGRWSLSQWSLGLSGGFILNRLENKEEVESARCWPSQVLKIKVAGLMSIRSAGII